MPKFDVRLVRTAPFYKRVIVEATGKLDAAAYALTRFGYTDNDWLPDDNRKAETNVGGIDPVREGGPPLTVEHGKTRALVIIESPYACSHPGCNPRTCDTVAEHVAYARAAFRDCILRGELPSASHLMFTQEGILRDEVPEERQLGIDLGLEMRRYARKTVVYDDYGLSRGMKYGIADAEAHDRPVEWRKLPGWPLGKRDE